MFAKCKAFLARLPGLALQCAAVHSRHPLERWLALVEEERARRE
jgi:hypothetical protein